MAKEKQPKQVEAFKHTEDKRKNNPTAEAQSLISTADAAPKVLRYPRNVDLDPQFIWRGKDAQDAVQLPWHRHENIGCLLGKEEGCGMLDDGFRISDFGGEMWKVLRIAYCL